MPDHTIELPDRGKFASEVTLSFDYTPQKTPGKDAKHILVIGGGVSGLMTSWILLDKGYRVTILSDHWASTNDSKSYKDSRLTSQTAGALWEFPPGGCGLTEIANAKSGWTKLEHYEEWALQSYEFYQKLITLHEKEHKPKFGVHMAKLNQFFYAKLTNDPHDDNGSKLAKIEAHCSEKPARMTGFQTQDFDKWKETLPIGPSYKNALKDGYTHDAPIINTDTAMAFLMSLVSNKGAEMETVKVERLTSAELAKLGYKPDGVINATGLGARTLDVGDKDAGDNDVYPVRGGIKRIDNTENDAFTPINEAYLVPAQKDPITKEPTSVVFLVPRDDDILIVGSIIQQYNNQLDLTPNSPEVEKMWKRARTFLPSLDDARPISDYPFAQGLRPFSSKNAKVRADENSGALKIVQNYGHGGSGWTLAVGCARTAVKLLESMVVDNQSAMVVNEAVFGKLE